VLAEAGVRPAELTAIVAGTGPGPFTGLRVGLATAAAMGQALAVPTYGVCSLDGIGLATGGPAGEGAATGGPGAAGGPGGQEAAADEPVLVATDARRREVYWALYVDGERVSGPEVSRPADLVPLLAERGVRRAYGEGARRYRQVLGLPVAERPDHPDPALLVAAAADRIVGRAPGERLQPRYLRRPDAAEPRPPKPATRP
jgi:tRNA threonylcarbamoyl adenosine modification protein YeaZ